MKFIDLVNQFYDKDTIASCSYNKTRIRYSGTYQNPADIFTNNPNGEVLGYIHNGTECIGILQTKRSKKCFYMVNLANRNLLSGYGLKCVGIDIKDLREYFKKLNQYKVKGNLTENQIDELLVLKNI